MGQYRKQRLIDALVLIAISVPLMIGAIALLDALKRSQCPNDAFLTETLRGGVATFAMLGAAIGATGVLRLALADHWPWLRQQLRPEKPEKHSPRWAYGVAGAAVLIGTILSVWACLCDYCATPHGITYRMEPWDTARSYSWDRLAGVASGCHPGRRGSWNTFYIVVMDDHASFNLMETPRHFADAYTQVARALHGKDYVFDAHRVDANCGSPYRNLLITRP